MRSAVGPDRRYPEDLSVGEGPLRLGPRGRRGCRIAEPGIKGGGGFSHGGGLRWMGDESVDAGSEVEIADAEAVSHDGDCNAGLDVSEGGRSVGADHAEGGARSG